MKKQYIVMNVEENRVLLDNHISRFRFSGEIGNSFVRSFKPLIFKSKFSAFLYKFPDISWKIVPVVTNSYFAMTVTDYIWLKFKDEGKCDRVIKAYREDCRKIPIGSHKIYHSGKVVIEGIGNFTWSDFVEFVF